MNYKILLLLAFAFVANAQLTPAGDHVVADSKPLLDEMWGELWPFQGINTFAHLEHHTCLTEPNAEYDLAIIGVPFDTATSYRSGARFGPRSIRAASQRQTPLRGYNPRANFNPYQSWASIVDCGDIPVTPMDNTLAFKQLDMAFEELVHSRKSKDGKMPRYVALGGDHSIILPHLRALHSAYGPINVIHFDAHLDTWKPDKYPSFWLTPQSQVNHGLMLWKAFEEGLLTKHNVHAGIRTKLLGPEDLSDDDEQHWIRISADEIWVEGVKSVIDRILSTVDQDTPTYISVDIDVLDPGFGLGTGTQEPGGWLPRELIYVLRALENLTVVGADVVEVNPAFDNAEITATNGAQVAYEILTSMAKKGPIDLQRNESPKVTDVKMKSEAMGDSELAQKKDFLQKIKQLEASLEEVASMKKMLQAQLARTKAEHAKIEIF